jgi:hypothetical protein
LGQVLALLEAGRQEGAVGAEFHTLPFLELPHVWLFSLCPHLDVQESHQEAVLTLFMVAHSELDST